MYGDIYISVDFGTVITISKFSAPKQIAGRTVRQTPRYSFNDLFACPFSNSHPHPKSLTI